MPTFAGSSSLASVAVNGVELGLENAVNETVRLIGSQTIDPSNVDISRIVRPPGVDLSALQAVIQPVLNALPNVTVPATVARIRVIPNERIESGTRLIQRALHAEITIAGQRLADVVAGEASVGVDDVNCGGVAGLALECTLRRLVLIDVYEHAGRVRLLGAADRRYIGRRVRIRFMADGRTVARPRVRRDGTFRATAPLPDARIRGTNRARYEASIRKQRSMRLKLMRRMLVTEMSSRGGIVTIAGRVLQPLAEPVADRARQAPGDLPAVEGRQALPAEPGRLLPRPAEGARRRRGRRLPHEHAGQALRLVREDVPDVHAAALRRSGIGAADPTCAREPPRWPRRRRAPTLPSWPCQPQ